MVTVIMPAWNEQTRIAGTVHAALAIPEVDTVLVVDDGSTDATAATAAAAGAAVITLPVHKGKGQALAAGVAAAEGDVLLLLDADLGASAAQAAALLTPVLTGQADMAIARFARTGSAGFGLARGLARWGIARLTGWRPESPLSGQRAIRRRVLEKVRIAGGWGAEVGLTVDCLRQGFQVCEVPVGLQHRPTGRDWRGFLHRGRQLAAVLRVLGARWLRWGCGRVTGS